MIALVGKLAGAVGLCWLRKHAVSQAVELIISGAEKAALMSETKLDDDAVAKLREDKEEIIRIIKSVL